ncbi:MAG: hypothetical protein ABIH03_11255 [Pseudomonadota bacterium]
MNNRKSLVMGWIALISMFFVAICLAATPIYDTILQGTFTIDSGQVMNNLGTLKSHGSELTGLPVPSPATLGATTITDVAGAVRRTTITFASVIETLTDGSDEGESQLLMTFPEGRILIIGAAIDADTANGGAEMWEASDNDHYFVGIGTAAAEDDATLSGTECDIIAAQDNDTAAGATTTFTWEADMTAGADTVFDGTATAVALYFNTCAADTSLDATGTITLTGSMTVIWVWLGDD